MAAADDADDGGAPMTTLSLIAGAFLLVGLSLASFMVGVVVGAMMIAAGRPEARKRPSLRVVK